MPCRYFVCDFFLVTAVDQMVLGLVSCPPRTHFTTIIALRNGKFSKSRCDSTPLIHPVRFIPEYTFLNLLIHVLSLTMHSCSLFLSLLLLRLHNYLQHYKTLNMYTVETCIREPRFCLSSLDRFFISGLLFLIAACRDVKKVLMYTTCFACIYIVFSTRILDDFLYNKHFEVRILV